MPDDDKKPGLFFRLFGRGPVPDVGTRPDLPNNPDPAAADMAELALPIEALDPIAEAESFESLPPAVPVAPQPAPPQPAPPAATRSWWQRLKEGLTRSSSAIGQGIGDIFLKRKLDATTLEELEDVLIQADLGVDVAARISGAVAKGRFERQIEPEEVRSVLAAEVEAVLTPVARPLTV